VSTRNSTSFGRSCFSSEAPANPSIARKIGNTLRLKNSMYAFAFDDRARPRHDLTIIPNLAATEK
jgi:hypothetical protein